MAAILALDIASTTGWARWAPDMPRPAIGAFKAEGDIGRRALEFETWLAGKCAAEKIVTMAVEAAVPMSGTTTLDVMMWLYGAHVIAKKICAQRAIKHVPIANTRWRSHFIGVSRAPAVDEATGQKRTPAQRRAWLKRRAIEECMARGWDVKGSNDAADALGVLSRLALEMEIAIPVGEPIAIETLQRRKAA